MTEYLRRTEEVSYGIKLAGWAVDRAMESTESNAVRTHLEEVREELQLASEQLSNIVADLPADRSPRKDVLGEIQECLRQTREF
jgi:hypothetical protein